MNNIGEELVGQYLKHIKKCDFISYNVSTPDTQGEIDVIGICIGKSEKRIYICEVAIHLETGLQYTKNKRPDNIERLKKKFSKDIEYAQKYFQGYEITAMLWSPIVKKSKVGSVYNQMDSVLEAQKYLKLKYKIEIELVINESFEKYFSELKEIALNLSEEAKSPVIRLMQIEGKLSRHLNRVQKKSQGKIAA